MSLASAKAALLKLENYIGSITPKKILKLTDEELKQCYFSRQKILYTRGIANAIINRQLSLSKMISQPDDVVRMELRKLKGIGDWTADVFLMMSLRRMDYFPTGDVAFIASMKKVKNLQADTTKDEILLIAEQWKPYRTIAAYILWHAYLERKKQRVG